VKLLRSILPLKIEQIPWRPYTRRIRSKSLWSSEEFGEIKREEWRADGSWYGIIEMPAGLYASFLNKLGDVTKGSGEAKIVT
jgi:ribosome maturation protein SDO1